MKGYIQGFKIDYNEVFAFVARFESIQFLIALAGQERWRLHHVKVKSDFLIGEIKEEIYVIQHEGFVKNGKEEYVLKLKNALYGLKQAPGMQSSMIFCQVLDLWKVRIIKVCIF